MADGAGSPGWPEGQPPQPHQGSGQRPPDGQYGAWAPPDQSPYQGLSAPGGAPGGSMWQAPVYGGPVPPWQSRYGQDDDPFRGVQVAEAWPRLGARILDSLIVGIPFAVLGFVLGYAAGGPAPASSGAAQTVDGLSIALFLAEQLVRWLYNAAFIAFKGGTPGKLMCGIRVIDERTGRRISFGRAVARELVLQLSGLLCLVGYFSLFFDTVGLKRGWHDRAVHSRVVRS